MPQYTVPTISPQQFAQRLAANFPNGWSSPEGKGSGNVYAMLLALGTELNAVLSQIRYADNAILIPTETSPELDLAAQDFYGNSLPMPPGATDASYANLILSGLFLPAATRSALSAAVQRLTGYAPRMIEPWNPGDTGAWDAKVSYWDVDHTATPFLWTGEEVATGFIRCAQPIDNNKNLNPIYGWDDSWYWDVAGSSFFDTVYNALQSLYSLINQLRAEGVLIGVKVVLPSAI